MSKFLLLLGLLTFASLCLNSIGRAAQIMSTSGECIDLPHGNTADGNPSQHWGVSNGQIVGIGGKCLDSMRGGTADGTPLIIVTCSNNPTQQWSLQ